MSDPFDQTQGTGTPTPKPPAAPNADPFAAVQPKPAEPTLAQNLARGTGLTARAAIEGVAGLPMMAMDAGVATRNLLGDLGSRIQLGQGGQTLVEQSPDYELPSSMWERGLTEAGLPEPHGALEKTASLPISMMTGGAMPGAQLATESRVPANFMTPDQTKAQLLAQALKRSQDEGFVVPPSTTNPTMGNRILETVAGKENVQNFARRANDAARQKISAESLGLNPDTPMTVGSMDAIKAEAGQAYEVGRGVPQFRTSDQYLQRLTQIEQEGMGANESFPGAAKPEVSQVIDTYLQPSMTGQAAVSAIKLLRTKASDAFSSGNSEVGRVYRQIQGALEDELERGATAAGQPNLVQRLRAARMQYAKASTIQDAMEPDGTVTGPGLARAWNNNVPMSGSMETAAEFARQFPKANLSSTASGSPVHHFMSWESLGPALAAFGESGGQHGLSMGTRLAAALGAGVAMPLAREGARRYLLSPAGQRGAIPNIVAGPGGRQISPGAIAAGLQSMQANQ